MSRTWTIDERVDFWQCRGLIKGPSFTPEERSLAWSIGAAQYFIDVQQEFRFQFLEGSNELFCFDYRVARTRPHAPTSVLAKHHWVLGLTELH